MNKKNIAIIVGAISVILIASLGACYAFDLNLDIFGGPSTDFDTKFMSGTFTGDVSENNNNDTGSISDWTASYEDKTNNITYNMSCVKDGSFITDLYMLQGLGAPEVRNYNDVPWKIFYSQAVPDTNATNDTNSSSNSTINVYICEADINDTAYTINVIAYNDEPECDGTLFCPLYQENIEPLVKSIEFKDSKKAPEMYDILNMSKEEFEFNREYINGILNGTIDPSQLQ